MMIQHEQLFEDHTRTRRLFRAAGLMFNMMLGLCVLLTASGIAYLVYINISQG